MTIGGRVLALANLSCTFTLLESGRTHMKTYVSGMDRVVESPIAIQPALLLSNCSWNSTEFAPVVYMVARLVVEGEVVVVQSENW